MNGLDLMGTIPLAYGLAGAPANTGARSIEAERIDIQRPYTPRFRGWRMTQKSHGASDISAEWIDGQPVQVPWFGAWRVTRRRPSFVGTYSSVGTLPRI